MKKIYFLFLISFFTINISAQTYYPMLDSVNHWQNITNIIPVRLQNPATTTVLCTYPVFFMVELQEYTTQDTIISSETYKIVHTIADYNPTACEFGYVREDTAARKVFFRDNLGNPEILLYDFSMQIGNTIPVNFISPSYLVSGTYTLDSIKTIHIRAGFRRIFYLNNHTAPFSPTLPWIESVGCPFDAFYPFSTNQWSMNQFFSCNQFAHESMEFMTCFDHVGKVYYDSCAYNGALANSCFNIQDTCNYHNICGSVQEFSSLSSMNIFPNPSNGKSILSLEVKQKDNYQIIVWDISGKKTLKEIALGKIPEGKKEIELDLSFLANGIYLVECISEKGSVFSKLIIEK